MHAAHRILLPLHRKVAKPFLKRPRLIVVFGVMRSGTSLLTNLLTNNEEISGFGESHIVYTDNRALLDLKYWIFRFTYRYPQRNDFLLDKILHAGHLPDLEILLDAADLYPIFMLREPAGNAQSLQKMFQANGADTGLPWDYLIGRYNQLQELVSELAECNRIQSISYEKLTNDSEATLSGLSEGLNILEHLTPKYKVPSYVGRWGLGDGSKYIRSGLIMSSTKAEPFQKDDVPDEVTQSYEKLCQQLKRVSRYCNF